MATPASKAAPQFLTNCNYSQLLPFFTTVGIDLLVELDVTEDFFMLFPSSTKIYFR